MSLKICDSRDDSLLVLSDYLEEIGEITLAQELREEIRSPKINLFHLENKHGFALEGKNYFVEEVANPFYMPGVGVLSGESRPGGLTREGNTVGCPVEIQELED
jgi:hypothetical protein